MVLHESKHLRLSHYPNAESTIASSYLDETSKPHLYTWDKRREGMRARVDSALIQLSHSHLHARAAGTYCTVMVKRGS